MLSWLYNQGFRHRLKSRKRIQIFRTVALSLHTSLMQPEQLNQNEPSLQKNKEEEIVKTAYPPRNPIFRFLQILYSLYALICFLITMFVVVVAVSFSPLFGKTKGGNFAYTVCKIWAIVFYFLTGIRHKEIYESPHDTSKQYIFIANHISYMDIPAAVRVVHQPIRILGKYEMVKYPIFGIIYRMVAIVVDRSSSEKRAQSVRALKAALYKHISIFIFPEGTFNETSEPLKDFYDGAFRIAIETGTPIKPILFVDTWRRMHYRGFLELTPGRCRCIYLAEIDVTGLTMKDVKALREKVYAAMDAGLRRYNTYPLPLNVY